MKHEEARLLFRGEDKLNCAQALLKAFQEEFNVPEEDIQAAAKLGGGKAPHGECGALYAARLLIKDHKLIHTIAHDFETLAGSTKCRSIRKQNKLSCGRCVAVIAQIMEADAGDQ